MKEERKKLRVIKTFVNVEDAAKEMFNHADGTKEKPKVRCAVDEKEFLMNVASRVYCFMLQYEAGEISKAELELFLRKIPLPKNTLVNVSPLDFNFIFWSSINKRLYTNCEYYLEELDQEDAYTINELYSELSIMYSFDSIIDKMRELVSDFKAANHDLYKMTMSERVTKLRAWKGNEDYINNDFLEKLLDKCRKDRRD